MKGDLARLTLIGQVDACCISGWEAECIGTTTRQLDTLGPQSLTSPIVGQIVALLYIASSCRCTPGYRSRSGRHICSITLSLPLLARQTTSLSYQAPCSLSSPTTHPSSPSDLQPEPSHHDAPHTDNLPLAKPTPLRPSISDNKPLPTSSAPLRTSIFCRSRRQRQKT